MYISHYFSAVARIGFESVNYETTEGETVDLVVQRLGAIDSPVEFTVSMTILGGILIFSESGTFNASSEEEEKIKIPYFVIDDEMAQRDHENTFNLEVSHSQVELFNPNTTVLVRDNDGK